MRKKKLKRDKWPTIRNLVEFMYVLRARTFFYDDELLNLMKLFALDYDIAHAAMAQVGWLELFTYSGERMHYRPVWKFKKDGTPDE